MSAPWATAPEEVLSAVHSSPGGLADDEAQRRRAAGAPARRHTLRPRWRILLGQYTNPVSLVLIGATLVAMALGDVLDGVIIIAIILVSGLLGYWQERRADVAVAELLASVEVTCTVLRDGQAVQVPTDAVVAGDIVELRAGDLVPADARILNSDLLLVDESALTGESYPVEKDPDAEVDAPAVIAARRTVVMLGSHVVSGSGRAVVYATGEHTEFGRVTASLRDKPVRTAFELGVARFGWLLVRLVAMLTVFIFIVNWLFGRPVLEALLFSLSLAVGITPQMLPAIVSLSLASGARRLAHEHVVVKRLDAIEDLGALTVLCSDKTGTLTTGSVEFEAALGRDGEHRRRVLELAALNAAGQRSFRNPMDRAIVAVRPTEVDAAGELPYDFQRKRLSVLVPRSGKRLLITKGAVPTTLPLCTRVAGHAERGWADDRQAIERLVDRLCATGRRVVLVASRAFPADHELGRHDESGLTFEGLLVFRDPPKAGAVDAVRQLAAAGVDLVLITGDSVPTARAVAADVGLPVDRVMTGLEVARLDDTRLAIAAHGVQVFAEVEPLHKARIVAALRAAGAVVGYLGDGINDAPALRAADVGISVDDGVAVAKEAASVVLLERGLEVVAEGVRLGRRTFANTLKYIRLTTSANFGNMVSLAVASLFLPFLPLLPRQILLLNFLSDIPALTIASDEVDDRELRRPLRWNLGALQRFMIVFGLLSTVFDLLTFAVLILGFGADDIVFRSAWFVMSTLTELTVLFSLRTAGPIWRSRPARSLLVSSIAVAVVTAALPFVPGVAPALGLEPPGLPVLAALALVLLAYLVANELLKRRFAAALFG